LWEKGKRSKNLIPLKTFPIINFIRACFEDESAKKEITGFPVSKHYMHSIIVLEIIKVFCNHKIKTGE
jgi:hypothetical protein